MKVLYAGFKGNTNSAKVLLDNIDVDRENKLYLTNSFETSVLELESKLTESRYDLIIAIGQLKLDKNVVRIEKCGRGEEYFETSYDYSNLRKMLEERGFIVEESNQTNYLCNNIYYHGMKYIHDSNLKTKMIFVHVPKLKNIGNIDLLAKIFLDV